MARSLCALALIHVGCGARGLYDDPSRTYADAAPREVSGRTTIHRPPSLSGLAGPSATPSGAPVEIRCATCHAVLSPPPALPTSAQALGGPHAGLRFEHGANECRSCHDPAHYDRLRLASGDTVPMTEALALCAQCHGPQYRDFLHGAHGGMNGHWDLRRGDRTRNHCVDCHDPHAPRFPRFLPMPPPRDAVRAEPRHE